MWVLLEGEIEYQGEYPFWCKFGKETAGHLKGRDEEDGVQVFFRFTSTSEPITADKALADVVGVIRLGEVDWIQLEDHDDPESTWIVDLHKLAKFLEEDSPEFLRGIVRLKPIVEASSKAEPLLGNHVFHHASVSFYLTPDMVPTSTLSLKPPVTITDSLQRFRADHPDPDKIAFLMMRFDKTPANENIVSAVRDVLSQHGLTGLRADDKEYHDDLMPNVQTYMHGCSFGIAIFERIETNEFNPNVGLEVGYMMAMGKPVCLLKDRTLTALQSDLIGKLYRQFDVFDPAGTIPGPVEGWLRDKGLIPPSATPMVCPATSATVRSALMASPLGRVSGHVATIATRHLARGCGA